MSVKQASTDVPIHEFLARRWSPYGFQDRQVPQEDLRSIFEAARWAPSSYNEQPWSFLVAPSDAPEAFEQILSCLVEGNQIWARHAPVLALGIVHHRFSRTQERNRAAVHDLGLATGNLLVEATARGLFVHPMIGILPDKAREVFSLPDETEAWTGLALGYVGDPGNLPDTLRERDRTPRHRKPIHEFVFTGSWGNPAPLTRDV